MQEVRTLTARARRPSVRTAWPWLGALLLLTVALAACSRGTGTASTADRREAGRLYAQCMRDNGVPDFPDPDADGRLRGPGHETQADPKFRPAMETCRQQLPGGG